MNEQDPSRRDFLKGFAGFAGSIALAGVATTIRPETRSRELYNVSDVDTLQKLILEKRGNPIQLNLPQNFVIPEDYQGFQVSPFLANGNSNERFQGRNALLFLPPGSNVVLNGGEFDLRARFPFGIYSAQSILGIYGAVFKNGASPQDQYPTEESAYIFSGLSSVLIDNCTFNGGEEVIGNAPVVVGREITGYRRKGLNGVYMDRCNGTIQRSRFYNQGWDSITSKGGKLNVSGVKIHTANPDVLAGSGIGLIDRAKAIIEDTEIQNRAKGIGIFNSDVDISNFLIDFGSKSDFRTSEAIFGSSGRLVLRDSKVIGTSTCIYFPNSPSWISNCEIIMEFPLDIRSALDNGSISVAEAIKLSSWSGEIDPRINLHDSCQVEGLNIHVCHEMASYTDQLIRPSKLNESVDILP